MIQSFERFTSKMMNKITLSFFLMTILAACVTDDDVVPLAPNDEELEFVAPMDEGLEMAEDVSDELDAMLAQKKESQPISKEQRFYFDLSHKIVDQLMRNMSLSHSRDPLIVATPVLAVNFAEHVTFSYYLQQSLMTNLHNYNFTVLDVNIADVIQVKPSGEFVLSRDWSRISAELDVQMVLVSTLVPDTRGITINARLVNVHSRRVVGSSILYIGVDEMPNFFKLSYKVTISPDQVLEVNESEGMREIFILQDDDMLQQKSDELLRLTPPMSDN